MAVQISSFGLVCIYGIVSYTCISMTKSLICSYEKMIHAYASIWRSLMHDIILEIRVKACVQAHHLEISTQEWKWKQLSAILQRIYERLRGGLGALAPPPPTTSEANGMQRSQIKWKLLLFDESDFLFF